MTQHNVYVIFTKPKNHPFPILSNIIRKTENVDYSHVAFLLEVVNPDSKAVVSSVCHAAMGYGVVMTPTSVFARTNEICESIRLPSSDIQTRQIANAVIANYEKSYSYLQLAGMFLVLMAHKLFKKKIKNPFRNGSAKFVCTEFVSSVLQNTYGITLPTSPEDISLKQINNVCRQLYK